MLVVIELTGGNDGLNTVIPYANDLYYRNRPGIGIPANNVLKLSDEIGLHPAMSGIERLYKDGRAAIVQGCSYPNPSRSHFEAMEFWHTGVPNGTDSRGWLGRYADAAYADPQESLLVNIDALQTLAVRSSRHPAIVFDDPRQFVRKNAALIEEPLQSAIHAEKNGNETLARLRDLTRSADRHSAFVQRAYNRYRTPVDYGGRQSLGGDLQKVAALIAADLPARIYYVSTGGFDTHAGQGGVQGTQARLLGQVGDAVAAFEQDLDRLGRAEDVLIMVFTEFGRRVKENASRGTDHGIATPIFLVGKSIKGGLYSNHPSLEDLDDGDLKMTTDYRSVYATVIESWLGLGDSSEVLYGKFDALPVVG